MMTPIYFLLQPERPATASGAANTAPDATAMHEELGRVLSSPEFRKAPRARALLRFLVHQMIEGNGDRINEYAIGIEVFRRDAAGYEPGADPIVRVQTGRLRTKLAAYYARDGRANPLRIAIPLGRYRPCIAAAALPAPAGFTFHPLACLSDDRRAHSFTQGLNDELGYRLHRAFAPAARYGGPAGPSMPDTSYALEGSVRQEAQHLRTSIRLTERGTGTIVWSEQLDHGFDLPIARQEQLAALCCRVLRARLGGAG